MAMCCKSISAFWMLLFELCFSHIAITDCFKLLIFCHIYNTKKQTCNKSGNCRVQVRVIEWQSLWSRLIAQQRHFNDNILLFA